MRALRAMKKIDYSEFIDRHHNRGTAVHGKSNSLSIAVIVSIMLLYFVLMVFVVQMARVDQTTIFISILVFLTATVVAIAARRAQYLQSSQEEELILLKEVLEGSRGGRLITDSADNTLYYNQRFVDLCCLNSDEDISYVQLINMFSDNDKAAALFNALSDQAHRGLTDSIELYCEKRDYEGWYYVTAQPVAGHAGIIHWRLDNVTEKYTANRAIREEREKLVDFTDNAPVGFFSVDEQGNFIFANATFARWLGVDLEYLLDSATLHTYFVNPPTKGQPYDLMDHGGEKQIVELEMKGVAGKTFRASINQSIVHKEDGSVRTRAVVNDLTSEQEMHRALKASEDRFKRFYEDAPLGIVLVNKDGLIEDCNPQFAQFIGRKTEGLVEKHFKLLIGDDDRDDVSTLISKVVKGESIIDSLEVSLLGDNEYVNTAQLHARSTMGGEGVVLHFIDMTEKKSLEEQFVQSQKMQAVGQLAGGIAHDFNNLLTAIIGFCDLLLLRHKAGDPSFGDIMQIQQNSNRAANLVRQLLAFSRQQTLRQRVHDITDILTELSHLMRRLIGANIDLEMIHGSDLGLVKVDEGQMEQVLINLAVNARDAMDGGGSLLITTENYTNRQTLQVMQEKMPPGHWVLIKVTDTGCGISSENMQHILEPFFTTKDVGEGTGLGLATVYGIVRQSGGFLDIESEIGKGTTFLIYLPKSNEIYDEEDVKPVEPLVAKDLTGTECIMLVEDEDAVRTFSQRALANKGYDIISAEHGEAALELYEMDGQKNIDLLITDVVMPGMDGPTLAQRIRQHSPNLKIIFMSGYTEDKLKDHIGEKTYFLPKPFTLKILAAKVKEVLEE